MLLVYPQVDDRVLVGDLGLDGPSWCSSYQRLVFTKPEMGVDFNWSYNCLSSATPLHKVPSTLARVFAMQIIFLTLVKGVWGTP